MTEAERSLEALRIAHHARVALPLAHFVVRAADEAGFTVRIFRSERQSPWLARARKACMVAARDLPAPTRKDGHYSYLEIGRALNRDHSTVHNHVMQARRAQP